MDTKSAKPGKLTSTKELGGFEVENQVWVLSLFQPLCTLRMLLWDQTVPHPRGHCRPSDAQKG